MSTRRSERTAPAPAISEEQFGEIQRCANDPIYFLENYARILDPVRGPLPFKLFSFQNRAIKAFLDNQYTISLKSRQMGFSWLVCGFVLWLSMFHSNKNVLMISIKEGTAKRLLDKIKYIYDHLPTWLRVPMVDDNKTLVTFAHNSRVESVPTSEEAGRSEGVTLLVIDEAAFVRWIDKIWQAAEPTLSTGGMCILLSTPNGIGNFYHKTWVGAIAQTNGFAPIFAPWWEHPVYGAHKERKRVKLQSGKRVWKWVSPWYLDRVRKLGPRRTAQEIDCEFPASGANFFDMSVVSDRFSVACKKVKYISKWNNELRIFQKPKPDEIYVLGLDTATGHGDDHSAVSIREFTTHKQVCTYRTQLPISMFAENAEKLARLYNNAFIVGEENGVSIATLLQLRDTHHYPEDLIYQDMDVETREDKEILGWNSTQKSRRVYLRMYEQFVRESPKTFKCARLLAELTSVIVKPNGRVEAAEEHTDDMVFADVCCLIGLHNYQPCGALPYLVA